MANVEKILKEIDNLSATEQSALLALLQLRPHHDSERSGATIHPSIVVTADLCGGAARLIRTRIPVWTVERMRQLGVPDSAILESYPTLEPTDLVEAWKYAQLHRQEIDAAIQDNEQA